MIRYPLLLVNFKTYEQSTGENAMTLTSKLETIRDITGAEIAVAPQFYDLKESSSMIPTFSQHIDPISYGSNTGSILPDAIRKTGACGTLLNHSERRIPMDVLQKSIQVAKANDLIVCACADSPETGEQIARFPIAPDMIAVEPPELIGSGISVSQAQPEIVSNSVEKIKAINQNIHVLCGAGVSTGEDVAKSISLGAEGVLVASAVVCSNDPKTIAKQMAEALK
ncbi:triose-phosphate isomerase [Candidatus Undinarchaeota archaeon]